VEEAYTHQSLSIAKPTIHKIGYIKIKEWGRNSLQIEAQQYVYSGPARHTIYYFLVLH